MPENYSQRKLLPLPDPPLGEMIAVNEIGHYNPVVRFKGKAVVITGGAMGIGAGCARVFATEGGRVAILDRACKEGKELARQLKRSICIECDVIQPRQFQAAVDRAAKTFGRLDCIINNVGSHPPAQTIDETSVEEFEKLVRLNLTTTFMGCKFALPHLRKTRGSIINISSMVGVIGQARAAAYCATKAAQIGLTKSLAIDLGPLGIRVNAVCPSNVDTPLMRSWAATLEDPKAALDRVAKLQVLGRMASPEEIGRICLFLATDDSSFITGQALEAEGGSSLDY